MEQTEFVDYEEPSGIQPSQFAAEQEADREQQEEYEAEPDWMDPWAGQ